MLNSSHTGNVTVPTHREVIIIIIIIIIQYTSPIKGGGVRDPPKWAAI